MIKIFKITVWVLAFLLFSNAAYSINEQYKKRWYFDDWFSESAAPYTSQQQLLIQDARLSEMYSDPDWQESFCNQNLVGTVTLGIREKSFQYIDVSALPSLSFDVGLRIQYLVLTPDGLEPQITEETLHVDMLAQEGEAVVETAKSRLNIPGAVMLNVQVLDDFSTDYDFLYIESEINIKRIYHFNKSAIGGDFSIAYNQSGNKELHIEWPAIPHAEQYDLEWVFLSSAWTDNNGQMNYHTLNEILLSENPFSAGATRIQTWKNAYEFPLVQRPGVLLFRFRGLGYEIDGDGNPHWVEGKWTDDGIDYSGPNIPSSIQANAAYYISDADAHEPEKTGRLSLRTQKKVKASGRSPMLTGRTVSGNP